jgi:hypothetical protein
MRIARLRRVLIASLVVFLFLLLVNLFRSTPAGFSPAADDGFAYVFYATTDKYACSVLVNADRLKTQLRSLVPIHVLVSPSVSSAYIQAFRNAGITVHQEEPPPSATGGGDFYKDSLLKLVAFKLHQLDPGLKRVLVLDSDQLVMKSLDALFYELPLVDLAAPHAYWIDDDTVASTFMVIQLSDRLWEQVSAAMAEDWRSGRTRPDMDLVNDVLGSTAMKLGGEYVTLNSHWESWNLPPWYHPPEAFGRGVVMPRMWEHRPNFQALQDLYDVAPVIHFTAAGKPWTWSVADVHRSHMAAHPVLTEQFKVWRESAMGLCPGNLIKRV